MRRVRVAVALEGVAVLAAGCSGSADGPATEGGRAAVAAATVSVEHAADPARTTEADWDFVTDLLDRKGKLSDGTVHFWANDDAARLAQALGAAVRRCGGAAVSKQAVEPVGWTNRSGSTA